MLIRIASFRTAAFVATAVVTILLSGKAQAHPQLAGTWTMGNNYDILEVTAGQQIGNGVWQGQYLNFRNGGRNYGTYILRLNNQNEGTCTFRWAGGEEIHFVNLQSGRMVYGTALYIRNW
ncbi:MAG: hypothetical protein ACLQU5_21720 [Isosphaeraceae bacterium]|jgi:hypothetical protein